MAGVWTSVCVMFPALDAKAAGFNVYAMVDASGDPTEFVSRTAVARFIQAGVVPTSTNAVVCELHRTWRRPEAAEIAEIYTAYMSAYDPKPAFGARYCANSGHGMMVDLTVFIAIASATARSIPSTENG
jgi:Isochorismatase family